MAGRCAPEVCTYTLLARTKKSFYHHVHSIAMMYMSIVGSSVLRDGPRNSDPQSDENNANVSHPTLQTTTSNQREPRQIYREASPSTRRFSTATSTRARDTPPRVHVHNLQATMDSRIVKY
ncbi:hypothetical protein TNCV_4101721 [Trichonephila clavipes]|nr:hypothetical protein TNCV_4101721 [Trichonephila clavipes]